MGSKKQIVLVTDGGQIMRCPVDDVRIAARKTLGVTVFRVAADERVVSVAAVPGEENGDDSSGENGDAGEGDADRNSGPDPVNGAATP